MAVGSGNGYRHHLNHHSITYQQPLEQQQPRISRKASIIRCRRIMYRVCPLSNPSLSSDQFASEFPFMGAMHYSYALVRALQDIFPGNRDS